MHDGDSLLKKAFGEDLRSARLSARLTQEQLAFGAGLDRTYVSLLERGLKNPTLTTVFHICRALKLRPAVFLVRLDSEREPQKEKEHV